MQKQSFIPDFCFYMQTFAVALLPKIGNKNDSKKRCLIIYTFFQKLKVPTIPRGNKKQGFHKPRFCA
jgi:hypothetical protein